MNTLSSSARAPSACTIDARKTPAPVIITSSENVAFAPGVNIVNDQYRALAVRRHLCRRESHARTTTTVTKKEATVPRAPPPPLPPPPPQSTNCRSAAAASAGREAVHELPWHRRHEVEGEEAADVAAAAHLPRRGIRCGS